MTVGVPTIRSRWVFAFRPVVACSLLVAMCVASGFALQDQDEFAPVALAWVAGVVLLTGLARSVLWLVLGGSTGVSIHEGFLSVTGGPRPARSIPLSQVRRVVVRHGDRFPELTRWASLPTVSVETMLAASLG